MRISLRQEALEVPPQDIITRDNVTLKVNAVIFLRVVDPNKAVVEVSNYALPDLAVCADHIALGVRRAGAGRIAGAPRKINLRLQSILDTHTAPWGVKVTNVEVKQVDMPESMLRAMAKQAEAEREKRSKIIHAEGEFSAAQRLVDAAHLLATEPSACSFAICKRSPKSAWRRTPPSCSRPGGCLRRAAHPAQQRRPAGSNQKLNSCRSKRRSKL